MNPPPLTADTEALLQGYQEGTLTPAESSRLLAALRAQPELVRVLLDGLRLDALIRQVVSQNEAASAHSTTFLPERASKDRSRLREEAERLRFSRLTSASSPRRLRPSWNRPMILALAAAILFFLGLAGWFFGPTMGKPAIAEVKGTDVSVVRGTEFVPATTGMMLQTGDALRLGTNASATIGFGAEQTRLELHADTELKLASLVRGKQFVLTSGEVKASVARQRPLHPMIFTTPQAEARVLGTEFTLATTATESRLEVTKGTVKLTRTSDGTAVKVSTGHYAVVATEYELVAQPLTGKILREYWTNLPGDYYVTYLTSHRDFPDHPSGHEYLDKFEAPSHWGTNYGARLCGFLHPPKTGDYTFWLATSDGAAFFLSPDDLPESKQQLAYAKPSSPHEWTSRPGQQSAAVPLVAGRKYYIEALQKQGLKTEDHLAVAWQGPGREREVIPGKFLSPLEPKSKGRK